MHFAISVNYLASLCPALPQSACLPCLGSSQLASSVSLAWGPLLMRRTPSCVSCDSRQISTTTRTTTLETITQWFLYLLSTYLYLYRRACVFWLRTQRAANKDWLDYLRPTLCACACLSVCVCVIQRISVSAKQKRNGNNSAECGRSKATVEETISRMSATQNVTSNVTFEIPISWISILPHSGHSNAHTHPCFVQLMRLRCRCT